MAETVATIITYIFMAVYFIYYRFTDIFYDLIHGSRMRKAVILGLIGGSIYLFFFKRPLFIAAVIIYIIANLAMFVAIFSKYRIGAGGQLKKKKKNPVFGNMSRKRAEKKYNKLINKYRSEQMGDDDFIKMLEISKAYSEFLNDG